MLGRLAVSARAAVRQRVRARLDATRQRLADRFSLPARYRGGLIEKWTNYWAQVTRDYADVAVGIVQFARAQPARAALYATGATAVYQCVEHRPDWPDYMRDVRRRTGDLALVAERQLRPEARDYMRQIEQHLNHGRLRHVGLGVVSLVWLADYDAALALYQAQCPYTLPHWRTYGARVVDVGFCGRWWRLQAALKDYDVVDEE